MADEVSVDLTQFNKGIAGLIDRLGIEAKKVLKKEAGELTKTLIKISPPADPAKTRSKIENSIRNKFELAANERSFENSADGLGVSKTGLKWSFVDSHYLRGVAPQSDMRQATAQTIYNIYRKLTKSGRIVVNFKRPREHQKVMIATRILTKKSTLNKVIARVKSHVGRLKAGWLVSFDALKPTGGNQPPAWVTRHRAGARGQFTDQTSVKDFPTLTIRNYAKGAGSSAMKFFAQKAVNIRAKAMAANLKLFLSGKKNLSDYR